MRFPFFIRSLRLSHITACPSAVGSDTFAEAIIQADQQAGYLQCRYTNSKVCQYSANGSIDAVSSASDWCDAVHALVACMLTSAQSLDQLGHSRRCMLHRRSAHGSQRGCLAYRRERDPAHIHRSESWCAHLLLIVEDSPDIRFKSPPTAPSGLRHNAFTTRSRASAFLP